MIFVILKPSIEVTSSTRYLYENFLSYDCSDHANLRFFVRSFANSVRHVLMNLRTQNLRTETGVRTFVNSTPGSEDQYASLYAKCCADRSNRCRDIVIFILLTCRPPPSSISLDLKFVTDQTVTRAELRHHAKFRWNRWNCGRDMTSFRFFKMAAAMLDFWNYKFLTVGRIISVELRHHAKFCSDR